MLMDVLPSIQEIWNEQHESHMSSRISLISKNLVKEIIPQEVRSAQKTVYLALKDPSSSSRTYGSHAGGLFDPIMFNTGIQGLLNRGVKLSILIGNIDIFIENAHPVLLKTLVNGLIDGIIDVKALNQHLPQSFLLVDHLRLYLFFLDELQSGMKEALRTERQSIIEFFILIWEKFWESAFTLDLQKVVDELKSKKEV